MSAIKTIIFPVSDLSRAKTIFGALAGAAPYADFPNYVGFRVDGQEIGLDPNGHRHGTAGPIGYWHVENIRQTLQDLTNSGAEEVEPIRDVGGGKLIAIVRDPDGNIFGLSQEP